MLDNNDNGPEFSQPSYDATISEDILPDTEILQIEAIDRDEKHKLSYTIHSSIDTVSMRKFRIDPNTGVLYTAERLDHEAQDKHILNVMVRMQYSLGSGCSHGCFRYTHRAVEQRAQCSK